VSSVILTTEKLGKETDQMPIMQLGKIEAIRSTTESQKLGLGQTGISMKTALCQEGFTFYCPEAHTSHCSSRDPIMDVTSCFNSSKTSGL
jgi:hypothetical protein